MQTHDQSLLHSDCIYNGLMWLSSRFVHCSDNINIGSRMWFHSLWWPTGNLQHNAVQMLYIIVTTYSNADPSHLLDIDTVIDPKGVPPTLQEQPLSWLNTGQITGNRSHRWRWPRGISLLLLRHQMTEIFHLLQSARWSSTTSLQHWVRFGQYSRQIKVPVRFLEYLHGFIVFLWNLPLCMCMSELEKWDCDPNEDKDWYGW